METGDVIALVAAAVACAGAGVAVWQAIIARTAAADAKREADAAEIQANAAKAELEILKRAEQRQILKEQSAREASMRAELVIWRETHKGNTGSRLDFVIVENAGEALARELGFEVLASADGNPKLLASSDHMTETKPELRPGWTWHVPLMQDVGRRLPIEVRVRWDDESSPGRTKKGRVERVGKDSVPQNP